MVGTYRVQNVVAKLPTPHELLDKVKAVFLMVVVEQAYEVWVVELQPSLTTITAAGAVDNEPSAR